MRRTGPQIAILLFTVAFCTALLKHGGHYDEYLRYRTDSLGYYQFLPKLFLDHEIEYMHWFHFQEDGKRLSIFTIGVAWLQLPFFLLGHLWAVLSEAPRSGFSTPYAVTQLAGAATYLALAGWMLFTVLARYHRPGIAAGTVLLLHLGTNLYYYTAFEAGMSHGYSFFLFAALLLLTERLLAAQDELDLLLLFPLAALIVLVRPLNALVLLLPVLYRTRTLADVGSRLLLPFRMPRATAIGLAMAFLLVLPQLLYWHAVKGQWFLFTYGTKGEAFDFSSPHLFDLLVSHQNGWFVYTPLMLAAMGMLSWKARERGNGARSILLVWGITWYFYGCWWAWWLGGAFGYRGFIEYTALLALPLGLVLERIMQWPLRTRRAGLVAMGLLVFVNIRLSALYSPPWDGADWSWGRYWEEMAKAFFLG